MNRRNFLAIIPAISSIPIIGNAFEKDKEKIVIYQPEDITSIDKGERNYSDIRLIAVDKQGNVLAVSKQWNCRPDRWFIESFGHKPMLIREGIKVTAEMDMVEGVTYSRIVNAMRT